MSESTQDPKALLESILNNLGFETTVEEKDKDEAKYSTSRHRRIPVD